MKLSSVLGVFLTASLMVSCSNGNDRNDAELKDPSVTHPPSEAIPDSMQLVNDSVIMPDRVPNNGAQVGNSDSIQKNKQ
ncbi:MAG: hypothetical protein EOO10_13595 [Chitinophagaceae bacterium]|nr:MAG: hypothetical protein EOO10_13595 [Chitinophagaceae bacterium]